VVEQVRELTGGGAQLSLDCLGSAPTCQDSLGCLRPRGRHVQVGLPQPAVPMGRVLALELEVLGSHGLAAHAYPALLALVADGTLHPERLVTREIGLDDAAVALAEVGQRPGIAVITSF
jgi:alcohol dehydrogenase